MSRSTLNPPDQSLAGRIAEVAARVPNGGSMSVAVRLRDGTPLVEIAARERFPAASTIKVAILIGLAQAVDAERLSLDDARPVTADHRVAGSGVLNWLATGISLSLRDHAWLMTAISDNTASNVLIDAVGIDAIQGVLRELGMHDTRLVRRFLGRLPTPGTPENIATAHDLTNLLLAVATDNAASTTTCGWMRDLLADQQHRDRLARSLPGGVTYAGKTGSLTGIAHDCGLLTGPRGTVAVAVLTRGIGDPYIADELIGRVGSIVADGLR